LNGGKSLLHLKMDTTGNMLFAGTYELGKPSFTGKKIETDTLGNYYVLASADSSRILKYNKRGFEWQIVENETFNDLEVVGNKIFYTGVAPVPEGSIGGITYTRSMDFKRLFVAVSLLNGHFTDLTLAKISLATRERQANVSKSPAPQKE